MVTGFGAVSPVGLTAAESWENVLNGRSGIGPLDVFDVSDFSTRIGGSVRNFDITQYISDKEAKKMDVFIHYGLAAGCQAIEHAGLAATEANAERIAWATVNKQDHGGKKKR